MMLRYKLTRLSHLETDANTRLSSSPPKNKFAKRVSLSSIGTDFTEGDDESSLSSFSSPDEGVYRTLPPSLNDDIQASNRDLDTTPITKNRIFDGLVEPSFFPGDANGSGFLKPVQKPYFSKPTSSRFPLPSIKISPQDDTQASGVERVVTPTQSDIHEPRLLSESEEEEAVSILLLLKKDATSFASPLSKKRELSVSIVEPNNSEPPRKRSRRSARQAAKASDGYLQRLRDAESDSNQPTARRALFLDNSSPLRNDTTDLVARSNTPSSVTGMRMTAPNDAKELNSLHCFVRSELLELFTEPGTTKVGLRCVHCGQLSRKQRSRGGASMSMFFPKSLQDIYRGVCTWQRIHFKSCTHVPEELADKYRQLKECDRTRGKKQHWVTSAYNLGLRDRDENRNGLVWEPGSSKAESI